MAQLDPRQLKRSSLTPGDRDAALARVGRTRRWVLGAAAALTAGLAALASALVPGRSLASKATQAQNTATTTTATGSTSRTAPPLPAPAPPSQLGLQSPGQAPQAPSSQQSAPPQQPSSPQQAPPPQQAAPAPQPQPSAPVVSGGS